MNQKKNKTAWILFGIAIILLGLLLVLLFHEKEKNPMEEISDSTISVALNGIEFDVPREYTCYPDENSDLLIYNGNDCSMLVRVTEESYEELREKKEMLLDKAKAAGHECLTGIMEEQVGEHSYLYFVIEYNGRTQYAIYTGADENHCFRIVMDASDRNQQEVLELAESIFGTARETERENTTIYDLLLLQIEPAEQEYISEAVILDEQGNVLAVYNIPEGFFTEDNVRYYQEGYGYEQSYISPEQQKNVMEGKNIFVTVSLKPKQDNISALEMMERKVALEDLSITAIRQTELNGYTVYYYGNSSANTSKEEMELTYEFYAVLDFDDEMLYQLEGWGYNREAAMELSTYEAFLTFEK